VTWPNDVLTRTVTGTYLTALGQAAKGRVTFTPSTRVVDEEDAVVIEDPITAPLDANGSFEVELPATDNKLLSPQEWAYSVNVRLHGVKPQKFYAKLPYGDGSNVDLISDISLAGVSTLRSFPTGTSRGPAGPRGPGVLVGEGAPNDDIGQDGDLYIDSISGSYYGPKASREWSNEPFYVHAAQTPSVRHVHTQSAASTTWTVTHTLGGRPSVTIVDSSGTVVIGEIAYNSDTQVTISFTAPFSGFAYLT
jgi:hypothetical protein